MSQHWFCQNDSAIYVTRLLVSTTDRINSFHFQVRFDHKKVRLICFFRFMPNNLLTFAEQVLSVGKSFFNFYEWKVHFCTNLPLEVQFTLKKSHKLSNCSFFMGKTELRKNWYLTSTIKKILLFIRSAERKVSAVCNCIRNNQCTYSCTYLHRTLCAFASITTRFLSFLSSLGFR